ncbi:MAG TPA: sensor histidine kinase [Acetobacteraceae bacterium]|jgi:signal transduction histidine kinase|nr:sensor histidine kinase [Acetobacteraceae bacterium]
MGVIRSTSIRSVLIRVVLIGAVPVWLASALLLYKVHTDARTLIERDAAATARTLMVAVDRDLASAEATALALATSPSLTAGDFAAFSLQAESLLHDSVGSNFVLSDATGQQLINTLRPYGEELPRHGALDLLRRVIATGKPGISDLYTGGVRQRPVVSIDVPVLRGGEVAYILSSVFIPERLGAILQQEHLPAGWVASVFDSKGIIVARTHGAEQFVGRKGAPALIAGIAQMPEGIVRTNTLEGTEVAAAFTRSEVSNWAVAIGVPTIELSARLWSSFAWSVFGTLFLLAAGLIAAHFAGRRIIRPILALASQALASGRGERVTPQPLGLKEADDLAAALAEGSRQLERRTEERDRAEVQKQEILIAKRVAEEAAQGRSAWFAYLSHELRTPLHVVRGCAELIALRARASPDPAISGYCERIDRAVEHVLGVANEILDYAKYEAQELELHVDPLDAAAAVRDAALLLDAEAFQAGVNLRCVIVENLPRLRADPVRLRQILLNLLSNAVKFTPRGGSVTIEVALADDDRLMIRVRDTGVGISTEDIPRILQPFAQVASAQVDKPVGTGLGLPLAKGLVELHGGSLAIASTPGVGTTVTVLLPTMAKELVAPVLNLLHVPG